MKIAAVQMVSTPRWADNQASARALLEQAAAQGVELAVLPEYFGAIGARDTDKLALREAPGEGPMQAFLAESARALGLWIVGGTVPLATPDPHKVRNTVLAYAPGGDCVARYDKIHLFGFKKGAERYDESATIAAGSELVAFDTPFARVGVSICYDLRFPELYRALGVTDLLVVPAAFTETTGRAHWEILLRARAIENQAYVLAPAQGGQHPNGRRTWGHSMLIDPWGQILGEVDQGPGLALAQIDRQELARVRSQLPARQHRIL